MTDLPISDAKTFLENWAAEKFNTATSEEAMKMLIDLTALIDEEFAGCSLKSEEILLRDFEEKNDTPNDIDKGFHEALFDIQKRRLALWSLILGGVKTVLAVEDQSSLALTDFSSELINRVRGVAEATAFDIPRNAKIIDTENLWLRAQVIVVLEKQPARARAVLKRAADLLGLDEAAVKKLVDNFKNGRQPKADLTNLVETAKRYFPVIIDKRIL
jgi:hypothetical protein